MEEEERRSQIQIRRRRGEREPQIQIPPHLPHQSRIVVFISECMEVARVKKREQEGRRSLEVAAVALHSGGIEVAWVRAGREGGKEVGAARRWCGRKCRCAVQARGVTGQARREERVEMET